MLFHPALKQDTKVRFFGFHSEVSKRINNFPGGVQKVRKVQDVAPHNLTLNNDDSLVVYGVNLDIARFVKC